MLLVVGVGVHSEFNGESGAPNTGMYVLTLILRMMCVCVCGDVACEMWHGSGRWWRWWN